MDCICEGYQEDGTFVADVDCNIHGIEFPPHWPVCDNRLAEEAIHKFMKNERKQGRK